MIATSLPDLPYRRISRLAGEMHLSGLILVGRALPQDFDRSIVLLLVMRVCAPDWTSGGVLHRPLHPTRFTSANSIATSLGRSPETIRRHVHALAAAGICLRAPGGITLNPDPAIRPDLLALYTAYHDLLIGFVADTAELGLLPPPAQVGDETLLATTIQTTLDIALVPIEQFASVFADWASMRVWLCISTLNVRHILHDAVLSERYSVASTPDDMRRPVPLRVVGRTLAMPYATVWRHCRQLAARGLISQTDTGWLVRVAQLRDDAVEEPVIAAVLYYLRRMTVLTMAGLDPARAAQSYLSARVPLVPAG